MAQTLRQIKSRIRSIENTEKITKAMEMVSVSKLKAAEHKLISLKEYFSKMDTLLNNLLADSGSLSHPLLKQRTENKKITLCLITSDTGLCGSYNNNLIRLAESFIKRHKEDKVDLVPIGRKGFNYFKRSGFDMPVAYTEIYGRYSLEFCDKITKNLIDNFLAEKSDEAYFAYMFFETAGRRRPVIEKVLNIEKRPAKQLDYLTEPGMPQIISELIPSYLFTKIRLIILNAFSAEHAARTIAMGEATENANGLLKDLVLIRNKVRQANITKELIEIISAGEALRS